MFKIKADERKKVVTIEVGGFFKNEEGQAFLNDYNKQVKAINPSNYSLIILGEGLATSSQEMAVILENTVNMYKSTGFKKYYGTLPKSASASMQLKKVVSKCGLDVTFGNSVEDILKTL